MPLQIIVSNSIGVGVRVPLGTDDDLFLGENATVGSTDLSTTIEGTGNSHHLDIQGTVVCQRSAINIGTAASFGQTLLVGENAYVVATLAPMFLFAPPTVIVGGDASIIDNRGVIRGFSHALAVSGDSPSSEDIRIFNSGLIEATSFGINASGQCGVSFVNTGEVRIYNLAGKSYTSLGSGADHVTNNGLMVGDIGLGQGNDVYSGAAGHLSGKVLASIGIDTVIGGADNDWFDGGSENDTLIGYAGNDTLIGDTGNDTLNGGNNNDKLDGGLGNDKLTGGANNDIFVFNTALNASTNRDTITDFNHVNDTFQLENAIFTRLGAGVHALNPAFFRAGAAAADANDYIVYNKATGALFYDDNGNGAGHAVMFAILANKPVLAANDFQVI